MSHYILSMTTGVDLSEKEITLTVKNLREIIDSALHDFKNKAKPYSVESDEFVALCYFNAVRNVLSTKGIDFEVNMRDIYNSTKVKG